MRYIAFLILLSIGLFVFVKSFWTRFKVLDRRFNFRITDIWASMVGLAPTMVFVGYLSDHIRDYQNELGFWIASILGVGLFQFAGLAVGRMDLAIRESEVGVGPITAWTSAISIVTGAWLGLAVSSFFVGIISHVLE